VWSPHFYPSSFVQEYYSGNLIILKAELAAKYQTFVLMLLHSTCRKQTFAATGASRCLTFVSRDRGQFSARLGLEEAGSSCGQFIRGRQPRNESTDRNLRSASEKIQGRCLCMPSLSRFNNCDCSTKQVYTDSLIPAVHALPVSCTSPNSKSRNDVFLRTNGTCIVDANVQVVLLRGVNFRGYYYQSPAERSCRTPRKTTRITMLLVQRYFRFKDRTPHRHNCYEVLLGLDRCEMIFDATVFHVPFLT
jgi:hypothetical protein